MLRRLVSQRVLPPGATTPTTPFVKVNVEAEDDFSVALVHAWAAACENLDFYTDHLAGESGLDTATDPVSVREIVRLIGYEPAPAIADSAIVAFTVRPNDAKPGARASDADGRVGVGHVRHASRQITIPARLQVRSVPLEAGEAQTFETSDDVIARGEWNALRLPSPPTDRPFVASALTRSVTVRAPATTPRRGDGVLFLERGTGLGERSTGFLFRTIRSVDQLSRMKAVMLRLDPDPDPEADVVITDPEVHLLTLQTAPFGADAQLWPEAPDKVREPVGTRAGWLMSQRFGGLLTRPTKTLPPVDVLCAAFGDDEVASIPPPSRTTERPPEPPPVDTFAYVGTDGKGVFRRQLTGRDLDPSRGSQMWTPQWSDPVRPVDELHGDVQLREMSSFEKSERKNLDWEPVGSGLEKARVTAIAVAEAGRIYAGTADEKVFVWTAETDRWEPLGDRVQRSRHGLRRRPSRTDWPRGPVHSLLAVRALGRDFVFAGTDRGVFRWTNERKGWRGISSGLADWDTDTARSTVVGFGFDPTRLDLFVATGTGLYRSRWLGYNWHHRDHKLFADPKQSRRVNDLLVTPWPHRKHPVMFAATDDGVLVSDDGGAAWFSTGGIDGHRLPVKRLAMAGRTALVAGTEVGVVAMIPDGRWVSWQALCPPEQPDPRHRFDLDPNLRKEFMIDVRTLAGHPHIGELMAAMPRGDFLEYDWPGFWIRFPDLDVPASKVRIEPKSRLVLRNRRPPRTRNLPTVVATSVITSTDMVRSDFGLDGKPIVRLRVAMGRDDLLDEAFPIRDTDVWAASHEVSVVAAPTDTIVPIRGDCILLDEHADPPPPERHVVVTGRPARARIDVLGGISSLSNDVVHHDDLAWRDVRALATAPRGPVFAVIDDEIWRRDVDSRAWSRVHHDLPGRITALAATADGALHVVADEHDVWSIAEEGAEPVRVDGLDARITALTASFDGALVAVTDRVGVWRLDPDDADWAPLRIDVPPGGIDAVTVDRDDRFVVATGDGVIRRFADSWQRVGSFAFTEVSALAATRDGEILVGTRPILRLAADDGAISIEPVRLVEVGLRSVEGLPDGVIPVDFRSKLAAHVSDLGDLVATRETAGAVHLFDPESHARYLVRIGADSAVVSALPTPLLIDRDHSPRTPDGVTWSLRTAAGRSGTVTIAADIVSFTHAHPTDPPHSEVAVVTALLGPDARHRTTLQLQRPLRQAYDPTTTTINANTAEVTAGATVREIVGNGDAGRVHQAFRLAHQRLGYANQTTELDSLRVEVTELVGPSMQLPGAMPGEGADMFVRWHEVPALVDAGPRDHVYEVRRDDQHHTTIRFGDGIHGARLPTGHGNVVATYRWAPPGAAHVRPGELTLLPSRPRSVTGVTNPEPSSGGRRAESIDEARFAAPRTTRSFGRILTLQDYEWFCEAYGGIEHASLRLLDTDRGEIAHISVASRDGSPIGDDVLEQLGTAIGESRGVRGPDYIVAPARWKWLTVAADLTIDDDLEPDEMQREAVRVLTDIYNPAWAAFDVEVAAGEVIARLQSLPGVIGVDLTTLSSAGDAGSVEQIVRAPLATWSETNGIAPGVIVGLRSSADVAITIRREST